MGEIEIRGYAVRFDLEGREDWVRRLAGSLWACVKEERTLFTLGDAIEASKTPRSPAVAVIFCVFADGREERLPSLKEALTELERLRVRVSALIDRVERESRVVFDAERARDEALAEIKRLRGADPLTALEAAEQRLLASEGWTYVGLYGGEQWQHAKHGREGRMTALSMARDTAKKGGS